MPLAVVDIRAKARTDPDAAVEPGDILAWERRHGPLPKGCCVACLSGVDPERDFVKRMKLPDHPFPGFWAAAGLLIEQRDVRGIAVDGMSLNTGANSPASPVHQAWLRSGRWAIEGLASLDRMPPRGATLVVGAAPIEGATGMPVRTIALV